MSMIDKIAFGCVTYFPNVGSAKIECPLSTDFGLTSKDDIV